MRQIRYENEGFVVSGDPEKLLSGLIARALTPPIAADLEKRMSAGSEGLFWPDLRAYPVTSKTDLNEEVTELEEPWLILREQAKPTAQSLYVEGSELRRLVRLGRKLAGL